MIARTWKATADTDKVKDYVAHFENNVYAELKHIAGFQGAYVMQKPLEDGMEIQVITLWESMDTIRTFAGDLAEQAVVEPQAQAVLRAFDMTVTHHEVLVNHQV
ncbi:MAG: antibiotic biosynthesis monooxygenase [Chloroflexi bacterium]|nr:antibiotic biosynthesis monooxygenase [Chloroflexota bacterium]MCC6894019.1 antibiotic biosynthesis monooxygenase [Anaerolineae bacterium]